MRQKGSSSQATKSQGRRPPAAPQTKQQPLTAVCTATPQKHGAQARATAALIQTKPAPDHQ